MGPLVAVVSVLFDVTRLRQLLPAAAAVAVCGWHPDNGRTVCRRWIEWGSVDAGLWR